MFSHNAVYYGNIGDDHSWKTLKLIEDGDETVPEIPQKTKNSYGFNGKTFCCLCLCCLLHLDSLIAFAFCTYSSIAHKTV